MRTRCPTRAHPTVTNPSRDLAPGPTQGGALRGKDRCQGKWARRIVTTMKFKGDPDWGQLARSREVAANAGYSFRSKHFFNNKNEVTLMLAQM